MIGIKIKTTDGTVLVQIPTTWGELSARQLIGVTSLDPEGRRDLLKVFQLLTGLDLETVGSIKSAKVEAALWRAISFLGNDPPKWDQLDRPKRLAIGSEAYEYPQRLGTETLGQKIRLSQLVQRSPDLVDAFPEAVAIYLQPYFDKQPGKARKFDADRLPQALEKIQEANGLDVFALGLFFLTSLSYSLNIGVRALLLRTTERRTSSRARQTLDASSPSGS